MRMRLIPLMTAAITLCSCGMQLGKYTVSSAGFHLLQPEFGVIAIDRGTPFGSSSPDQNLLCIVLLCPGAKTHSPNDSSSADVMFTSSRTYNWSTDSGELSFSYRWDRRSDTVEIGGSRFSRSSGDTFIAHCDGHGSWRIQQLSDISAGVDASGALREIQKKLPDDPFVASLSIYL